MLSLIWLYRSENRCRKQWPLIKATWSVSNRSEIWFQAVWFHSLCLTISHILCFILIFYSFSRKCHKFSLICIPQSKLSSYYFLSCNKLLFPFETFITALDYTLFLGYPTHSIILWASGQKFCLLGLLLNRKTNAGLGHRRCTRNLKIPIKQKNEEMQLNAITVSQKSLTSCKWPVNTGNSKQLLKWLPSKVM